MFFFKYNDLFKLFKGRKIFWIVIMNKEVKFKIYIFDLFKQIVMFEW